MKKNEETSENQFQALSPEAIREMAKKSADSAIQFIKKHPLESVGGALVTGFFIGFFINRKKRGES